MPRLPLAMPLVLAAALLAGCDDGQMKFAPACPQLSLLAEGADLARFAGAGRDVVDRVLEARVTGIEGSCRGGRTGEVVALIRLRAELRRGPAAPGRRLELPYFVAVMDGDQVLDRRGFVLEATFPANADSIRVAGEELQLRLPGGGERGAARYRIIVSLQLTPEELAFNRGQGR